MTNPDNPLVALAQAVKDMRERMPALLELNLLQAKLIRAKYLALVSEGFTPDQALKLCAQALP